jgi:hypothetical protein
MDSHTASPQTNLRTANQMHHLLAHTRPNPSRLMGYNRNTLVVNLNIPAANHNILVANHNSTRAYSPK